MRSLLNHFKIIKKTLPLTCALTLSCVQAVAQNDSLTFQILYQSNESMVDTAFSCNDSVIRSMTGVIGVDSIRIFSGASPEGPMATNANLGFSRSMEIRKLLENLYPDVPFFEQYVGEDWQGLLELVVKSNLKHRNEIARIIREVPRYTYDSNGAIVSGKKKQLMDLNGGDDWRLMEREMFGLLRRSVVTFYLTPVGPLPIGISDADTSSLAFSASPSVGPLSIGISVADTAMVVRITSDDEPYLSTLQPEIHASSHFSIKTNLLFDAATVANLAVAAGFAGYWEFEMSTAFSPWDIDTDFKIRTLTLQPCLRYYFSPDFGKFHIGLVGCCSWYNFAWKGEHKRYQDRDGDTPMYGGGLELGYNWLWGRHFGMDFSISAGYLKSEYDVFYNIENGARITTDSFGWTGPTGAGISLYYRF